MRSKKPLPSDLNDAIKQNILSAVGYGRPPLHTRFQKGQSGNPLGSLDEQLECTATPGDRSNAAIMRKVLEEPVKVREGDKVRSMPKSEALQRKIEQMALSGKSVNLMRDMKKEFHTEDARRHAQIEDDHAFWRQYIERYHAARDRARHSGKPLQGFWILPEDISFPDNRPVQLRGPLNEEDVAVHRTYHNVAKALLALQVYGAVTIRTPSRDQDLLLVYGLGSGIACLTAVQSTAMAAACEAYRDRLETIAFFGKRALAAELKSAWLAIGLRKPPLWMIDAPSKTMLSQSRRLSRALTKDTEYLGMIL